MKENRRAAKPAGGGERGGCRHGCRVGEDPGGHHAVRFAEDHQRPEIDARRPGVQSGLIATNDDELQALKLRGERNYIDIKLGKTKQPVRFGDITLKLEKVDPKRNKFTVLLMADDKPMEKKDKNIFEPVQFYTAKGGHIPYEIVINNISKDQIVGYLSTPKVEATR